MVFEVYTELVFKSPAANTPILEEHWQPASWPLEGGHILEAEVRILEAEVRILEAEEVHILEEVDLHIVEADTFHQVEVDS